MCYPVFFPQGFFPRGGGSEYSREDLGVAWNFLRKSCGTNRHLSYWYTGIIPFLLLNIATPIDCEIRAAAIRSVFLLFFFAFPRRWWWWWRWRREKSRSPWFSTRRPQTNNKHRNKLLRSEGQRNATQQAPPSSPSVYCS